MLENPKDKCWICENKLIKYQDIYNTEYYKCDCGFRFNNLDDEVIYGEYLFYLGTHYIYFYYRGKHIIDFDKNKYNTFNEMFLEAQEIVLFK